MKDLKECFYCGNNQLLADIAKSTGFRPDIAYSQIRFLERSKAELVSKLEMLIESNYLPDGETLRAVRADDLQKLIDEAKQ